MNKRLDDKLEALRCDANCGEFILADAKDADMAFGLAATGLDAAGRKASLPHYRDKIRAVAEQGLVDIVIMSASSAEVLVGDEGVFSESPVTPSIRANDSTDIWLPRHGSYGSESSRPFQSIRLDTEAVRGIDLGLYSVTFNNDVDYDLETLEAFKEFRGEASSRGFRYFLEVFAPNATGAVPEDGVGEYLNDQIARCLAGVTRTERPLFLKMPYCGPAALEELIAYEPTLVVGILGGSSGTTMDAFALLSEAKKHGARAALFGRKINHAEDQLLMIELLRAVADQDMPPEEAVRTYHAGLKDRDLSAHRALEDDLKITESALQYLK